jgi:transcription factor IIIB subunit 2
VNVFELGHTYLQLVHTLNLQLPLVDPSHFISRFAALLEFGDDTPRVASDAVRLVQRFDRDWLSRGRRPAGICGAALLLAARMNHFRRSVAEIVQVVKIADTTLVKRLKEFGKTESAKLGVADFRNVWLEGEADPPAFVKGREKEEREREEREGRGKKKDRKIKGKKRKRKRGDESESEAEELGDEEDEATHASGEAAHGNEDDEDARAAANVVRAIRAAQAQGVGPFDPSLLGAADAEAPPAVLPDANGPSPSTAGEAAAAECTSIADADIDPALREPPDPPQLALPTPPPTQAQPSSPTLTSDRQNSASAPVSALPHMVGSDADLFGADKDLDHPLNLTTDKDPDLVLPSTPSPEDPLTAQVDDALTTEVTSFLAAPQGSELVSALDDADVRRAAQREEVDELLGLDEAELDAFIMSEEEIKIKERVWVELNREYLEAIAGEFQCLTAGNFDAKLLNGLL